MVNWARRGVGEFIMKRIVVLFVSICMICVSISGAAVSVNKITESKDVIGAANVVKTSSESNTILLNNLRTTVNKYMSADENIYKNNVKSTGSDVTYPWSHPLPAGDFLNWWIRVNYSGQTFEKQIDMSTTEFKERLKHPWRYDTISFDVDGDSKNDIDVYYSVYVSKIVNLNEGINAKSLESRLMVRTDGIKDRTAQLEVWSEIHLNYGLIKNSKSRDISPIFGGKFGLLMNKLIEKLRTVSEKLGFTRLLNLFNKLSSYSQKENNNDNSGIGTLQDDNDYLSIGVGVRSPQGGNIPLFFEKRFAFGKDNIFQPVIFEHELMQLASKSPLDLIFGFQSYKAGSTNPTFDIAFSIEFNPAFYIRTQFIPLSGYIYYNFDTGSEYNQEQKITFSANVIKGLGDGVDLSLIFDEIDSTMVGNWLSFDLTLSPVGFVYKASKKFNIGILVSSPIFSGKVKLNNIPTKATLGFDVDATFDHQGNELFVSFGGGVSLNMDSNLGSIVVYYPKLGPDEPDVTFLKVSGIPSSQSLSAEASLYMKNDTMLTVRPEGHISLTMSSPLSKIETYYPKANSSDPDAMFITVPNGIPSSTTVGVEAELYVDLDNFSNIDNYAYGRIYRTSSSNIQAIDGYLPGASKPIVKITDIPASSEVKGKLEWNKLQGYAYAARTSAGGPDPIEINLEFGSATINNYLEIGDGHIDAQFHLAQAGYFGFDTANEMIGDTLTIGNTETGNSLTIHVGKVSADNLWASWDLDTTQNPIQVEDLALSGDLSLFEDFQISAVLQGKNMHFEGDWNVGEEGKLSFDFTQDQPVQIIFDDLFPNNPKYKLSGGVIINQDFHFDIKWRWKQGEEQGEHGYFKINEDTNDPNFDWIFVNFTYTPDGYSEPQYGVEVGGTNVGLIVWSEWWKEPNHMLPHIWWYVYIQGNFYMNLLWNGDWYDNVQTW